MYGHIRKKDSKTIVSPSAIESLCICGQGGFGMVYIVCIDGVSQPCVLKKLIRVGDEKVVDSCRDEFDIQVELFMNPKCFNRIPRPMYILDLLDEDYKGVFGFCMEFCLGGSVKEFARSWGKHGSSSISSDSTHFDPMTLDPLRVSALCVGMIECLAEVFKAKPSLVHRDIKPDNFLVRVDPDSLKCIIVLSDLGLAQIQDSISSSISCTSFVSSSKKSKSEDDKTKPKRFICGTLVYNSCEALQGDQSQESDAYSLGLTILAMFKGQDPFVQNPVLQWIDSPAEYVKGLLELISKGLGPKLSKTSLFKTLKTIEDGKFKPVYSCLNEIFEGLTKVDIDERMSVHEACKKVQSIKSLLPKIGEGWKCPSIEDIVRVQLAKHKGDPGCIEESEGSGDSLESVKISKGWDDSTSYHHESTTSIGDDKEEDSEEDLKKEIEALKLKLKKKEEKKKIETILKGKEMDLRALIVSIQRSSSQSAVKSLYEESQSRIKAIFDEYTSSPSSITSHQNLFTLCFECFSLFTRHFITHGDNTLKINLDSASLKNMIDCFLPSMVRVVSVLGMKEEESGTTDSGVSPITISLFTILHITTAYVLPICPKIYLQISSLLSQILSLGLRFIFSDSFIADILDTCRNIAFAKDDPTKDSLLSLLLPHILPWMKKYPDKKSFYLWVNILKNFTLDKDNIHPHKDRSSQLWFVFHPVLDVLKDSSSKDITSDADVIARSLCFFGNLSCIPSQAIEVHDCTKDGLLDSWFEMIKKKKEEGGKNVWGIIYWSKLIHRFSSVPSIAPQLLKYQKKVKWCKKNGG
ncbi:hypothetical protein ADUPG1_000512 [Aduncisulcus paluster]|uniref:Protein kinase domain-containing protein n=1 Tax=Aduncisulcus paluster TaxID=2918883 RepID=A0ABQ5KBE3_9EUKA|nr:hypothetical protein ADUPG1_000512 [Aduncisulcus paluster]